VYPYTKVKAGMDNVAGVKLPKFEHYLEAGWLHSICFMHLGDCTHCVHSTWVV